MATVKATVLFTFETDNTSAALIVELLKKNKDTRLSDNYGIFDYDPDETLVEAVVEKD